MKFKLPRQIYNQTIYAIASREVRKQKINVLRATKKHMREIAEICRIIEKQGLPESLVCKKLPNKLGFGIFLHPNAKPILKGQIIVPYSGELTLVPQNYPDDSLYAFAPLSDIHCTKEEQKFLDSKLRYHPRRLYSLNVDAVKQGNFSRFVNHSTKPNIVAELLCIPTNEYGLTPSPIEVFYFAKKTIHPGEQLLVCYEDEENSYWGPLKIKPVPITPKTFQLNSRLQLIGSKKLS
jgi:hypothetical protein